MKILFFRHWYTAETANFDFQTSLAVLSVVVGTRVPALEEGGREGRDVLHFLPTSDSVHVCVCVCTRREERPRGCGEQARDLSPGRLPSAQVPSSPTPTPARGDPDAGSADLPKLALVLSVRSPANGAGPTAHIS